MYLYMRANGTRTQNGNPFNQGFTLLELLVVILIIGVLVAFAALNYQQVVEKVKARIPYVQASFVIQKLDYLHKGGRCSG